MSHQSRLQLGDTLLHRWRLLSEIGRGATSLVFRASDGNGATAAVKVLNDELLGDPEARASFLEEGRLAQALHHPNIVRAIATGTERDQPFLIQEYVAGPSYAELQARALARSSSLPLGVHLWILSRIAAGLMAVHDAVDSSGARLELIHRDVKPSNVLLGLQGEVKLTDFGVARSGAQQVRTKTGSTRGTLAYLAPEQILSPRDLDSRVDLWALGVVAFEALTGRRLFHATLEGATVWNVVHAEIPSLASLAPDLPDGATRCIARCLSRDRERRPASAAHVAEVLEEAATTLDTGALEVARVVTASFGTEQTHLIP